MWGPQGRRDKQRVTPLNQLRLIGRAGIEGEGGPQPAHQWISES